TSIPPSTALYIDLEGHKLSRNGTISLITILLHPEKIIKIIDILALGASEVFLTGASAFTITPQNNPKKSLKSILEDKNIPKCLWDVRNDADALWALYKVNLAGITDIQLLENASRPRGNTYLFGLDKAMQIDLCPTLGYLKYTSWKNTKTWITRKLSDTDVFSVRPLDARTIEYCANDVTYLPALREVYMARIKPEWLEKAKDQSMRRVQEAQFAGYQPHSPEKRKGPWGSQ
ncbi:ribonuclease H-like domain-containing protein, partial [Podospora fimiseda]